MIDEIHQFIAAVNKLAAAIDRHAQAIERSGSTPEPEPAPPPPSEPEPAPEPAPKKKRASKKRASKKKVEPEPEPAPEPELQRPAGEYDDSVTFKRKLLAIAQSHFDYGDPVIPGSVPDPILYLTMYTKDAGYEKCDEVDPDDRAAFIEDFEMWAVEKAKENEKELNSTEGLNLF